jgi:ABC-type sugar transport system ATPase subunit
VAVVGDLRQVGEATEAWLVVEGVVGARNALLERKPAALSGGQRQRVAMGGAIVREPAAFLLDEPPSNLDAKPRGQMRNQLAALQRRLGTTTVYVTHDQTEAMTLGDRIAVLRHGEIQQVGSPQDLYRRPANLFVAGFIGAPAMNLLPARVESQRLRLPMTTLSIPDPLRDALPQGTDAVIAGIRPEHFLATRSQRAEGAKAGADNGDLRVRPDPVEWLGADIFMHFDIEADSDPAPALQRETTTQQNGQSAGHSDGCASPCASGATTRCTTTWRSHSPLMPCNSCCSMPKAACGSLATKATRHSSPTSTPTVMGG